MALLRIVLLLLYAQPFSLSLPITSTPLEDNPDNLAYAFDYRNAYEHESVRKIPKSIFITPNHPEAHKCRHGYIMGADGKCHKSQNFDLDPLDILKVQVETFLHDKLPTTVDYDYDYDTYDSTESSGPFYVPLGFGVREESPIKKDNIQSMLFFAENHDAKKKKTTTESSTSTESSKSTEWLDKWLGPKLPGTSPTIANVDKWADDGVAVNEDINHKIHHLNKTTPTNSATETTKTTTNPSTLIYKDAMKIYATIATKKKDHVKEGERVTLMADDAEEDFSSTENSQLTTVLDEDKNDESTTFTIGQRDVSSTIGMHNNTRHIDDNDIETTERMDEDKLLNEELQSELLFQDESSITTSINNSDGTTEITENDVTTELMHHTNDQKMNKLISISASPSNQNEKPIVIVPTVEQVQIVTPVQQSTTTNDRETSISQPLSAQSSTSKYNGELQNAELLDINDSNSNKQMIESVIKHELNEDAIETIDTNNRFVYTHLGTSSNEPEKSATSETSTTIQPITERSMLDQLKFINRFTEESRKNNRIRFPESPVNIFSNFQGGTIKFPGPVHQRTFEPLLFNRLVPENAPKKQPELTHKPLFSWMPAGTSFDFSQNTRSIFPRFWNKMPLIRDPAMVSNESSEQPRANSKSPTDNLYKDVSTSDAFKITSSKNYKHDNR